jgi:hypothetical protein
MRLTKAYTALLTVVFSALAVQASPVAVTSELSGLELAKRDVSQGELIECHVEKTSWLTNIFS